MPRRHNDDRLLTRWLEEHAFLITNADGARLGFSRDALDHRVATGRLLYVRPGVRADPCLRGSPNLPLLGALAAAGPGAVASHLSAAQLLGLTGTRPARPHITVLRPRRLRLDGVVVHQTGVPMETTTEDGIRKSTASRTLLDLAASPTMGQERLGRCIDQALQRHLTAVPKLEAMLRDWPAVHCPGRARLRAALDAAGYTGAPEASALERRMWRMLRRLHETMGLPMPVMEHRVEGGRYRLDFAWPDIKFAVEVDGYAWHWSPESKHRDERRRTWLWSQGWKLIVLCWKDVYDEPEEAAKLILDTYRLAATAA